MKKFFKILLIIVFMIGILIGLTGCGDTQNSNFFSKMKQITYTKGMMNLRNFSPLILDGHSTGELLDKALKNSKWKEDTKYNSNYTAVIVTGKDRKTGSRITIVWKAHEESGLGFVSMKEDNKEKGYTYFISYLMDYIKYPK